MRIKQIREKKILQLQEQKRLVNDCILALLLLPDDLEIQQFVPCSGLSLDKACARLYLTASNASEGLTIFDTFKDIAEPMAIRIEKGAGLKPLGVVPDKEDYNILYPLVYYSCKIGNEVRSELRFYIIFTNNGESIRVEVIIELRFDTVLFVERKMHGRPTGRYDVSGTPNGNHIRYGGSSQEVVVYWYTEEVGEDLRYYFNL